MGRVSYKKEIAMLHGDVNHTSQRHEQPIVDASVLYRMVAGSQANFIPHAIVGPVRCDIARPTLQVVATFVRPTWNLSNETVIAGGHEGRTHDRRFNKHGEPGISELMGVRRDDTRRNRRAAHATVGIATRDVVAGEFMSAALVGVTDLRPSIFLVVDDNILHFKTDSPHPFRR